MSLAVDDPKLPKLVATLASLGLKPDSQKKAEDFNVRILIDYTAAELRQARFFHLSPRHDISLLFNEKSGKGVYEVTLESWDEGDVSRAAIKQLLNGTLHAFAVDLERTAVTDAFRAEMEKAKLKVKFKPVKIRLAPDVPAKAKEVKYWTLEPQAVFPLDYVSLAEVTGVDRFENLPLWKSISRYAEISVPRTAAGTCDYARLQSEADDESDLEVVSARFREVAKKFGAPFIWDMPVLLKR